MARSNKKKPIKTRDYNMVNIIKGVTKAGVHKDLKKEANRNASDSLTLEELEEALNSCRQCGFPLGDFGTDEPYNPYDRRFNFCSDSCYEFWQEQRG